MKEGNRVCTFVLQSSEYDALQKIANKRFEGNRSTAVRHALSETYGIPIVVDYLRLEDNDAP